MSNKLITQNAFQLDLKHDAIIATTPQAFHPSRGWQRKAFNQLKDKPFTIINAPMGSGKSWMICYLAAYKMKLNSSIRCIIAVPQTIIAAGFAKEEILMPDGEELRWHPQHNLCNGEPINGTTDYIINWLTYPHDSFNDRILLCTHASLVQAYKKLKKTERLNLLQNLLLWIDEAHHLKNDTLKHATKSTISNNLGELVAYLLACSSNIQIGLATASFFRGDKYNLLTETMEDKFVRFNLPFDEYLKSMEHLKTFSVDFLICGPNYINAIEMLAKDPCKDIIYIPHPISRHSMGNKHQEVKNILNQYQNIHGDQIIDERNGLILLQAKDKQFKVLDLVDEDRRIKKKAYLNNKDLKTNKNALDLIITVGMFKEGANWIWADRAIIIGPRDSLVDTIQMMGRVLRDAKDKKHVQVIQLLPFSLDQQNEEAFLENLNNYLKVIFASLILEDIFNPISIELPQQQNSEEKNNKEVSKIKLIDLIPDIKTLAAVEEDVFRTLLGFGDNNQQGEKSVSTLYDQYQAALPEILKKHNIKENTEQIEELLWKKFAYKTLKKQGHSIEDVNFNIIKQTSPLEWMLRYTSDPCGIETLAQFRIAMQSSNNVAQHLQNGLILYEKFVQRENRVFVPDGHIEDGFDLFNWYRCLRRAGTITDNYKEKLFTIDPYFFDEYLIRAFFSETKPLIETFIKENGNAFIENRYICTNKVPLGGRVSKLRANKGKLAQPIREYLDSLGEKWTWDRHEHTHIQNAKELILYLQRNHHQKQKYPSEILTLIPKVKVGLEKYPLLHSYRETIEILAPNIFENKQDIFYPALLKYVAREGHARPPFDYEEDGIKIGIYVSNIRKKFRDGSLSDNERAQFESLPGWASNAVDLKSSIKRNKKIEKTP